MSDPPKYDGLPLSADDSITITKNYQSVPDVNDNIIALLENTQYKVTKGDYEKFLEKIKTINAADYNNIMKWFGVDSEIRANQMVNELKKLNPHADSFANTSILVLILLFYQVGGADSIIENPTNPTANWFTLAIKNNELDKLPFPTFPSTAFRSNWTECVILKLWFKLRVMAPDINSFFGAFSAHSTSSNDFFTNIFPLLTNDRFNYSYESVDDLNEIINYVVATSPGNNLSETFENFNNLLESLDLTYEGYVVFMKQLISAIGMPSNIKELVDDFNTYYQTVAYSDDSSVDLVQDVTADTILNEFIYKMPGGYFHPGEDFNQYIKTCIKRNYTVKSIRRDIALGKTYAQFMSGNNNSANPPEPTKGSPTKGSPTKGSPTKESFTSLLSDFYSPYNAFLSVFAKIRDQIWQTGKSMLEGYDQNSRQPDNLALAKFGITNFGKELGEMEDLLLSNDYGFSNWNDMMAFVDTISDLIQYSQLKDYVDTMTAFGASNRLEWNQLSGLLAALNIKSFTDVKTFLSIILIIDVKYSNFVGFITTLKNFKANLIESPPSLPNSTIRVFCKDMRMIGFSYSANPQLINNIVNYFSMAGYTLQTYKQIPSLTINALYKYGNSTKYNNGLFDLIQNPPLIQKLPTDYDYKYIITQMYLVASNQTSYNPPTGSSIHSIILTDIENSHFISLLYSQELAALKQDKSGTAYSNLTTRLQLMSDISKAASNIADGYSKTSTNANESLNTFYKDLSCLVQIAPMLMFEYLHQLIQIKSGSGNDIDHLVDPNYTYCKATTTTITANYRNSPPVVPTN